MHVECIVYALMNVTSVFLVYLYVDKQNKAISGEELKVANPGRPGVNFRTIGAYEPAS